MRGGGGGGREGEIVQVQGGHIIRATGRKDRHSKVYTAKGPRDRRVRLSAPTAIQFYDVQDRLGYDRPSKALDWLIKKAKSAIDKLAELPPFDPTAACDAEGANVEVGSADLAVAVRGSGGREQSESSGYEIQLQGQHQQPQSFFPTTSAENPMGFYPHQDLCLSLQSFQNPGLIHGQSGSVNPNSNHNLFSVGFEPGSSGGGGGVSWPPETNPSEMGRFSRLFAWSGGGGAAGYGGERGTLQSTFHPPPSIRAWDDLPMRPTTTHQQHQPSMAGMGVMGSDGFAGFCVPAQMQGGGEDVHGIVAQHYSRASSMSTDSSR